LRLSRLLAEIDPAPTAVDGPVDRVEISSVEVDANAVDAGALFVVLPFWVSDASNDVRKAVRRGAVTVVSERSLPSIAVATRVVVKNSCAAVGQILSAFYGHPSRRLNLLAVTGTNGKTTASHLVRHILANCGRRCEVIGTLGATLAGAVRDTGYTLPPAQVLQPLLAEMESLGVTDVSLEATSHGLALQRLAGTTIGIGGITNVSRDHLDFHSDRAAYAEAKFTLFREFAKQGCFNVDDPVSARFYDVFDRPKISVSGGGKPADLVLCTARATVSSTSVEARHGLEAFRFELPLVGRHNVENAAVALGMSMLAGVPLADAVGALERASPIPGRLEMIPGRPTVFVDCAHTPTALERVLSELRRLSSGRLICVFGAGGSRDRGKRPLMGTAVAKLADVAVVTTDNPRWEDPVSIINDVLGGMTGPADVWVEPDRRTALSRAIETARDDDMILVAGRGGETHQEIRGRSFPFRDADVCRVELATRRRSRASKKDIVAAYRASAGAWRRTLRLPVIAVGGAAGKTTTTRLIAAALRARLRVLATHDNLNGFVGVARTLFQLRAHHDVAVIEIGIDRAGAMATHAAIVRPDLAVLTTLGLEHLDGFGDLETAVDEEVMLFHEVARRGGTLVVNLDDPLIIAACERLPRGERIGFTLADAVEERRRAGISRLIRGCRLGPKLRVEGVGEGEVEFDQPLPGDHNARNLLAAIAVADHLGVDADAIRDGLNGFEPAPGRLEIEALGGLELIGDYYNANPVSMAASLEVLRERRAENGGRVFACLGEMAEMGDMQAGVHRDVAAVLEELEIEFVLATGEPMRHLVDELRRRGSGVNARYVANGATIAEIVLREASPRDVVLVKGSRSSRLESVWQQLVSSLWVRDVLSAVR
jgi:MurE/MurF fusion protein